jgi:hypothetical protein
MSINTTPPVIVGVEDGISEVGERDGVEEGWTLGAEETNEISVVVS